METDNPFEKVLDRLRDKGWCKDRLGPSKGPNCILGAEMHVGVTANKAGLIAIIKEQYPEQSRGMAPISTFNNHPETTFFDVERVLEKAAVKWEEERVMRDE